MNTVDKNWQDYNDFMLQDETDEDREDFRHTFYAGAATIINILGKSVHDGISDDGFDALLEGLDSELRRFFDMNDQEVPPTQHSGNQVRH